VHINRSVMVLEPASDVTLQSKQRVRCAIDCLVTLSYTHSLESLQAEQNALGPSVSEKAMLNAVAPQAEPSIKRTRKGPKGPNPLSVKKKAPKHGIQEGTKTTVAVAAQVKKVEAGNKRKRQRQETDGGDLSIETEPRPKRRRRHKSGSRPVDAV
jgi:U3 small nucleolar RNA-associated protein 23